MFVDDEVVQTLSVIVTQSIFRHRGYRFFRNGSNVDYIKKIEAFTILNYNEIFYNVVQGRSKNLTCVISTIIAVSYIYTIIGH